MTIGKHERPNKGATDVWLTPLDMDNRGKKMKHPPYALPTRQKETLDYIILHIERHDQSPTYSEIAAALNPPSNKQNVKKICDELAAKGFISRRSYKQRSIVVL